MPRSCLFLTPPPWRPKYSPRSSNILPGNLKQLKGHLNTPKGNFDMIKGHLNMPKGKFDMPKGNLNTLKGNLYNLPGFPVKCYNFPREYLANFVA